MTENVWCDGVRLNQVLLNLLSNATKYTPEGGSIQLSLSEEKSPKEKGHVRIHIKVKDNGIGMSPDFLKKYMNPIAVRMEPEYIKPRVPVWEWRLQSTLWTQWKEPLIYKVSLIKVPNFFSRLILKSGCNGNGYGSSLLEYAGG